METEAKAVLFTTVHIVLSLCCNVNINMLYALQCVPSIVLHMHTTLARLVCVVARWPSNYIHAVIVRCLAIEPTTL